RLIHKAADDSNLAGFEYTYDAVGNQLSAQNLQQALPYDGNKPVTHSAVYTYDSIYRLTGFKQGQWVSNDVPSPTRQRSWSLDSVGNWQQFSIQNALDTSENGTYNNSTNQMNEYDDTSTNGLAPVPDDDGNPDDFMVNTNPLAGDLQPDGDVGFSDLSVIVAHWLDSGCSDPDWCGGADIDQNSTVGLADYAEFAGNWLNNVSGFYNSAHDKNGNLVDDDIMEYYWDYDHRPINTAALRAGNLLTQVRRKSDNQVLGQYHYDALGRRIQKSAAGTPTVYVYDGWQVIAEFENGAFARCYVYGEAIDELLSMENASAQRYYYHGNVMSSIDAVTAADSNVAERYSYDAYGQPYFFDTNGTDISQSAIDNPYLFTARRYDDETGLYYFRTRYLHPHRGRFISPDTIGIWGDPANLGNAYTYVANSPASHVDPFGFQSGIDLSGPRGKRKKTYVFKYRPQHLEGLKKAHIMISCKDALELKPDDPMAKVLVQCKVIIISGGMTGKKG
ncbi:MAG: RHS repeat domain-containing protein, partial [Planctomycetota bacterium]